jgi:THO complex subunit 2
LDPNRVLDIILESFENSPLMFKTFIGLLKHYKAEDDTICQIVGFKFQSLNQQQIQQQSKTDTKQDQQETEQINLDSLYKTTSYLLKHNIIDLDSLMPHLYPNEQQIIQSYKEEFDSARQYAKKIITINLADSNPTQTDTTGNQQQQQHDDKINQILQQTLQATKIDNQKVNLAKNLIEIGDYKTALKIIEKLPQWYIASFCDITVSICKSIDDNLVDPIYKKYNLLSTYLKNKYLNKTKKLPGSNKTNIGNVTDAEMENSTQFDLDDMLSSFLDVILPILNALGPGVSYDTILFTKLIRICVSFLEMKKFASISSSSFNTYSADQHNKESTPPPTLSQDRQEKNVLSANEILATLSKSELSFYNQIYTILNEVLLPSLSMISMNPCLAIELWNLLKLFPYEMR